MSSFLKGVIVLILLSSSVLACTDLKSGMNITNTTLVCNDVFYLEHGITISGFNITLDCAGAILQGKYKGSGIYITDAESVLVKNCRLVNYDSAFLLNNVSGVFIMDNHLVRNYIGATFVNVRDSGMYNYDVSLREPVRIVESDNNMLSLSNRFISGGFCAFNYCNRGRSVVDSFRSPRKDIRQFTSWFAGLFPELQLKEFLWGTLTQG